MFLMRFTERAYVNYTADDVKNSPNSAVRLTFSNSHFDPEVGSDLYNLHFDEYEYSEEMGFDGLMLNEHHNTPTCLGAAMNLEAYADGIVSNKYTKQDVLNVVASPFFSAILDTLADDNPPIILYTALNPERDVFIDVSVLNETPLDTRYEAEWKGKIFFTNNLGKLYTFPLFFKIRESKWT